MLVFIAVAAFLATLAGGFFAMRFRDKLHLILGFSAGAVIGVAFFDLLPEALELTNGIYEPATITLCLAIGFLVYLIMDRWFLVHHHDTEGCGNQHHNHRGQIGAGSLSLHSLLDGVAIGFAFQVSSAVGVVVAAAVLTHDFSDGINTVSMILKNGADRAQALRWLVTDALAPVLGIILTLFISITASILGLILAVFTGFFLYIGASDLLPESHHAHPTAWTTIATLLGVVIMYMAIRLAGV